MAFVTLFKSNRTPLQVTVVATRGDFAHNDWFLGLDTVRDNQRPTQDGVHPLECKGNGLLGASFNSALVEHAHSRSG